MPEKRPVRNRLNDLAPHGLAQVPEIVVRSRSPAAAKGRPAPSREVPRDAGADVRHLLHQGRGARPRPDGRDRLDGRGLPAHRSARRRDRAQPGVRRTGQGRCGRGTHSPGRRGGQFAGRDPHRRCVGPGPAWIAGLRLRADVAALLGHAARTRGGDPAPPPCCPRPRRHLQRASCRSGQHPRLPRVRRIDWCRSTPDCSRCCARAPT